MQFVPTLSGEMIRTDAIERLVQKEGGSDSVVADEASDVWSCGTLDGRSHQLTAETVAMMSSTLVPCATGWFVPEELLKGPDDNLVGISKVPIVAWRIHADGRRITPITVDPDLSATGEAVGTPDGRVFLSDGAEYESLDAYLNHMTATGDRPSN